MAAQQETNSKQNGAGTGKQITTRPASVTDSPGQVLEENSVMSGTILSDKAASLSSTKWKCYADEVRNFVPMMYYCSHANNR